MDATNDFGPGFEVLHFAVVRRRNVKEVISNDGDFDNFLSFWSVRYSTRKPSSLVIEPSPFNVELQNSSQKVLRFSSD